MHLEQIQIPPWFESNYEFDPSKAVSLIFDAKLGAEPDDYDFCIENLRLLDADNQEITPLSPATGADRPLR